jgi:hypothetical protein
MLGTITLSILGGIATFFLPFPSQDLRIIFLFTMTLSVIFTLLYIGAAILLVASVSKFSSKLRVAYKILATGMILLALTQLLIPLATLFNFWGQEWFQSIQGMLYMLSVPCMYAGARAFGRLLPIKSLSVSFVFAVVVFIPIGFIVSRFSPDFTIISGAILAWLSALAAYIMWQIRQQASKLYGPAMIWLFWGLAMLSVALIAYVIRQLVGWPPQQILQQFMLLAPIMLSGAFLLIGSYKFYAIGSSAIIELPEAQSMSSSVDIIIYAASLASRSAALDPALDTLRAITSNINYSSKALSPEQQAQLVQVYLEIEQYLQHQDPLRRYDPVQLREFIARQLRNQKLEEQTFWSNLPPLSSTQNAVSL